MDKNKIQRQSKPIKSGLIETHAKAIVIIIGALYIVGPLIHINTLIMQKGWYFSLYSYMPQWLVITRYSFSWFQRIIALITAVGLLHFKEIYRKILIGICIFTITTVYWKHPYAAFLANTRNLDKQFGYIFKPVEQSGIHLSFEMLTVPSIIVHCLLNISFCGLVVYLLTRPVIKKLFIK